MCPFGLGWHTNNGIRAPGASQYSHYEWTQIITTRKLYTEHVKHVACPVTEDIALCAPATALAFQCTGTLLLHTSEGHYMDACA